MKPKWGKKSMLVPYMYKYVGQPSFSIQMLSQSEDWIVPSEGKEEEEKEEEGMLQDAAGYGRPSLC